MVTCLAMIMQKWSIRLKEGWTNSKVWAVLDASVEFLLIRPDSDVPLVFKKRNTNI